jgi:hypothetical protein
LRPGHGTQARGGFGDQFLKSVPQVQQVHPVAPEFASQLSGRRPLCESSEDQNPLGRRTAGALEPSSGVGVEHPRAVDAAVIQDRFSVPGLNPHSVVALAPRAPQTVGVEQFDEEPITGTGVQQIHDGEIHLPSSQPSVP